MVADALVQHPVITHYLRFVATTGAMHIVTTKITQTNQLL